MIVDDKGVIYSGSLEEMQEQFAKMTSSKSEDSWTGDLRLIEVLEVYR